MSTSDDGDEGREYGPCSFVHLDVASAYSRHASPSTPLEYVTTLRRQFPLNDRTPVDQRRPAIALADYGLQSAVKMAVACAQAGVEHLCGLRLRLVPEASTERRAATCWSLLWKSTCGSTGATWSAVWRRCPL